MIRLVQKSSVFVSFFLALMITTVPSGLRTNNIWAEDAAQTQPPLSQLRLRAVTNKGSVSIKEGLVWRVFDPEPNSEGKHTMLAISQTARALFNLSPGNYIIHAAFGYAGITQKISLGALAKDMVVNLQAGGLKLSAGAGEKETLTGPDILFDIYTKGGEETGGRVTIATDVAPGRLLTLTEGTYNIVSRYGRVNALRRADIKVEAGNLTSARIVHSAARVTLKLVSRPGGEALPNTSWAVLTPTGEVLAEEVGAFPEFVLLEGEYAVIARREGEVYNRNFSVEPGLDRSIEVSMGSEVRN